jgi:Xaa-Pro aminopeptidase
VNGAGSGVLSRDGVLEDLLGRESLDAIVCCSYEGLCYFAGSDIQSQLLLPERLAFFVAIRGAEPALLVCNIEESQVRSQSPVADVRAYVEFEQDPAAQLADLLAEFGVRAGRIGIEAHRLPSSALQTLSRSLPGITWIPVDRSLEKLQVVKTRAEVDTLGRLARTLLHALDQAICEIGLPATENTLAGELVKSVAYAGALPLFLFLGGGERTILGHPEPGHDELRPGSIWRTDFGARLPGGICADVARTGVVGTPSPEQAEIFAALRSAQDEVVAIAEPGRPARELFATCKRSFERSRLPFRMPHVGHGIGIGLHEAPLLEPANDTPLAAGTVMCIEPFALMDDRTEGYHTEDLIVVTADGPQRLTEPQHALLVIEQRAGEDGRGT